MLDQEIIRFEAPSGDMREIGEMVAACIQCGTCSGSCPTAPQMDHSPRRIMQMLQWAMEEEVLSSSTIWLCATCYSCTVRCPRQISITEVMLRLRSIAIKRGYQETEGMAFNKSFVDTLRRYGRVWEPELLIRYHLKKNLPALLGQIPFGLTMLAKRRITLLPERMEDVGELKEIFKRLEEKERGGQA